MPEKNYFVLYVTDATKREVKTLYEKLEQRGFSVHSLNTSVPGYQYGVIRTPVHRSETVKEGRLVLVEHNGSVEKGVLSEIVQEALPDSVDVLGFEGNLEYRTKKEAGK